MKYLLDNFKNEISYARKQQLGTSTGTNDKWDYYLNLDENTSQKSYSSGTYLLQTKWGQGLGYNRFCPLDPITNLRTIVGCGGVALGQILYYWQCRVFPDNSISYTPTGFPGPISLTFSGQNYNWAGMSKTSPDDYNAQLLYQSAVANRSNFSSDGTSSNIVNAQNAFSLYFGFNANLQIKNNFYNSTWINMLKSDIDAGSPIYYRGDNAGNNGHAWVIDGYKNDNTFHCNWGWYGDYIDEWYLLSALTAGGNSFNDGQVAILNVYPLLDACSGLTGSTIICSSNTSYSVSIPSSASVLWSKSSNLTQVGGNTGTTYTVYATNSSQSGTGFIASTIYNIQNQVFMTRSKNIWVGTPNNSQISAMVMQGPPSGNQLCLNSTMTTAAGHSVIAAQGITKYNWDFGNWSQYFQEYSPAPGPSQARPTFYLTYGAPTPQVIKIAAQNQCGTNWNQPFQKTFYAINCFGDNSFTLSPNPASNEIVVKTNDLSPVNSNNRQENGDESTTFTEIRIFDQFGNHKQNNKYAIGTKETVVNTSSLLTGTYFVQILHGTKKIWEQ